VTYAWSSEAIIFISGYSQRERIEKRFNDALICDIKMRTMLVILLGYQNYKNFRKKTITNHANLFKNEPVVPRPREVTIFARAL